MEWHYLGGGVLIRRVTRTLSHPLRASLDHFVALACVSVDVPDAVGRFLTVHGPLREFLFNGFDVCDVPLLIRIGMVGNVRELN